LKFFSNYITGAVLGGIMRVVKVMGVTVSGAIIAIDITIDCHYVWVSASIRILEKLILALKPFLVFRVFAPGGSG
jgi:hypothetical protein